MMYLALSYDHRLVDGKTAVQFLVTIKGLIEDPRGFFYKFDKGVYVVQPIRCDRYWLGSGACCAIRCARRTIGGSGGTKCERAGSAVIRWYLPERRLYPFKSIAG